MFSVLTGPLRIENSRIKSFKKRFMKNKLFAIVILGFLVIIPGMLFSLDVPRLKARVNDYAGILSPSIVRQLESSLSLLEKTDSTQVAILTIPSLKGEVLEAYSIKVAEKWKIGQKGKANGVILLIARDDRKVRIEVGRGLEGKLTDLISGRIIRNTIIPHFKRGSYDMGVLGGIADIVNVVKGQYVSADNHATGDQSNVAFKIIMGLVIAFLFPIAILVVFISQKSKIISGSLGGVIAAFGAYVICKAFQSSNIPLFTIPISGFIGSFLGVLPGFWKIRFGASGGSSGGSSSWSSSGSSGGSSSSSSSNGSSGSSTDSFSGGGGDFGGGGSSGSW